MSANSTVTQRRSSGNAEFGTRRAGAAGAAGAGAPVASAVPHSMQNFWPGAYGVEQVGQRSSSLVPHSMQNFAPGGFWAPQLAQVLTPKIVTPSRRGLGD
jgi:hypothetical protein